MSSSGFDLFITATEINDHHGVGILLQRLFPDSSAVVSLRTTSLYGGATRFGAHQHELCSRGLTLAATRAHLVKLLSPYRIRRIVCVPYYREEFVHALLTHEITGAPVCTYLMDDQNIFSSAVPDHWVARLLAISRLRLGISPELCAAYAQKYGQPIHLLPPVLPAAQAQVDSYWHETGPADAPLRFAMIGNVWTARRFDRLRTFVRNLGAKLYWYGNGSQASWLPGRPAEWLADGIVTMGHLPEEDLIAALGAYPFVLIPSGSLAVDDDNPAFSRLSLPSRLLFLHSKSTTPVVILGHARTAAGKFVTRTGTGLCVDDEDALRAALPTLRSTAWRAATRAAIRRLAPALVLADSAAWIWTSLEHSQPASDQFSSPLWKNPCGDADLTPLIAPVAPPPSWPELPVPGTPLRQTDLRSLSVIRHGHLAFAQRGGIIPAETTDPTPQELANAMLAAAVTQLGQATSRVLFLGETVPQSLLTLAAPIEVWKLRDPTAWARAGCSGDPAHFTHATTGESHPIIFPQFDAIVSSAWLGTFPDDFHALEGLALFLEACSSPTSLNLHYFDVVLHPARGQPPPAYHYLKKRLLTDRSWPGLEEMIEATDTFFMSEENYRQHWLPHTGEAYAPYGRPGSLGLGWRKPATS